jgi:predicted ATPase
MVPMLPCGDIDEMAAFWTSLGLAVTYRQLRPNPYVALGRNAIDLHYYGMDGVDPEQSHSTCAIVVPDTAPLYDLFSQGLRDRYGRIPLKGRPRITRPRRRANNAGLSGFSLIDPAGNWIRVTRRSDDEHQPQSVDDRTAWVSAGGGPLARALENAVVLADSHGDEVQAQRVLAGAIARQPDAPVAERAAAWAYLALAASTAVADDFPAGTAVVELAAVRDVSLVLPTIGRVLGLKQLGPSNVLDALVAYVGRRRHLLVLDNLEHLLEAAGDLAFLLDRCPGLVVLATSRAPLRLRVEQEYPLDPLPLPRTGDVAAVAASPAARVFLERARAVDPTLQLSPSNARAVAAICARLDGLPLALELAAAHARLLPPTALLDRLGSALSLVRGRDRPERQRTMTATLDWSHDLLTRDEQRLMRRLSVFAGGFTLEAAEQVAAEDGPVLPVLAGLLEQSLVTPHFRDEARYRMLEPVREYAAERLRAAGEDEALRDRHATFFCALSEQAGSGLVSRTQAEWLDRLEREHNNLQVALGTLRERSDFGRMARMVGDTWLYWALRGHGGEAQGWLTEISQDASPNGLAAEDLAVGQLGLAGLRYAAGDIAGTRAAAAAVVDLARAADLDELLAYALMLQGGAAMFEGDLDDAAAPLAEAAKSRHGRRGRLRAGPHPLRAGSTGVPRRRHEDRGRDPGRR